MFIAGEVFFRFRPRRLQDGLTVPLQLQMLPSEMLPIETNWQEPAMSSGEASSSMPLAGASPITSSGGIQET